MGDVDRGTDMEKHEELKEGKVPRSLKLVSRKSDQENSHGPLFSLLISRPLNSE